MWSLGSTNTYATDPSISESSFTVGAQELLLTVLAVLVLDLLELMLQL